MTNNEARKVLQEVWRNERTDYESVEVKEAIDRAIKTLKDMDRLEEENHRNFLSSQHIISVLMDEIKKLRGEEE